MTKIEVRISGLGGQGVVLAGQVLGRAVVYDGKNAVQTQSYGAEARGSMAKSDVIISDGRIGYPAVRKLDVLIAMNQGAVDKYIRDLKDDGTLIVDSTNVGRIPETEANIVRIPATEDAEKTFGEKIYANMLILGVLATMTCIVGESAIEKAIEDTVTEKVASVNKHAFRRGKELAKSENSAAS